MTPLGIAQAFALVAALGLGGASVAAAHGQAYRADTPPAPLFAADEPIALTLVADFDRLEDDRGESNPPRAAILRLHGAGGPVREIDLTVRTRGNFRLRRTTCDFPNLRLDFPSAADVEGTVFQGQTRLKLVGQCRSGQEYEQNTLEEYVAYRLYNLITEVSFQVRLVRLTYEDASGRDEPITRFAFLLENVDALAARLGGIAMEAQGVHPMLLDQTASTRLELFQYMIGNTDFSTVDFHNAELVRLPDGTHQAIPYDFDFSGLVDASYASPDSSLGTGSVRERVYRGFCRNGVDLEAEYALLSARRDAFRGLVGGQSGLNPGSAERAVRYLDDFFRVIDSPRARRRLIEERCRRIPN